MNGAGTVVDFARASYYNANYGREIESTQNYASLVRRLDAGGVSGAYEFGLCEVWFTTGEASAAEHGAWSYQDVYRHVEAQSKAAAEIRRLIEPTPYLYTFFPVLCAAPGR